MHELSIAMSLVDMAGEEAERQGARVIATHVRLGVLSGVVKEALLSAFEMASEGTPLRGNQTRSSTRSRRSSIAPCATRSAATRGDEWFACEVCGTPARVTGVIRGRELELTALELE